MPFVMWAAALTLYFVMFVSYPLFAPLEPAVKWLANIFPGSGIILYNLLLYVVSIVYTLAWVRQIVKKRYENSKLWLYLAIWSFNILIFSLVIGVKNIRLPDMVDGLYYALALPYISLVWFNTPKIGTGTMVYFLIMVGMCSLCGWFLIKLRFIKNHDTID